MLDFDLSLAHANEFDVTITNCTKELAVIGVMGPLSRDVLGAATSVDLGAGLPWLTVQEIGAAGVQTRVMRVSYLGDLGWELHVPAKEVVKVFKALEDAGAAHGIGCYVAYAANSMRSRDDNGTDLWTLWRFERRITDRLRRRSRSPAYRRGVIPVCPATSRSWLSQYRGVFGAGTQPYLDEIDRTIATATSGQIAGMIVESIQGYDGIIEMPPGYMSGAADRVRAAGRFYIADEVQSGFGRTGDNF